jgi:hypothetical protein
MQNRGCVTKMRKCCQKSVCEQKIVIEKYSIGNTELDRLMLRILSSILDIKSQQKYRVRITVLKYYICNTCSR